jgi:uncharacterized membrane protein
MVEAVIREGEGYAPSFYVLLAVAGLIGAVGILTNSQILIVGAMVVGPEYNAIIGVALGINKRVRAEVRDGLLALCWGFLIAIVLTLLFGLAVRASGKTPTAFLDGARPVADLINTPNIFLSSSPCSPGSLAWCPSPRPARTRSSASSSR